MVIGFKNVRCPHCGYRFRAAKIEENGTASLMPVYCPKCGQEVSLNYLQNIAIWVQEKLGGRMRQD